MVPYGIPGIRMEPAVTYCNCVRIDHGSSTPLYMQLAALLRAQIEDGTITTRLPSVKTLSQEHGVSHITAERALTTLRDDGLITAVIGKGYYVAGT
jgi:DNA-binding GntR family transcriptional regulator